MTVDLRIEGATTTLHSGSIYDRPAPLRLETLAAALTRAPSPPPPRRRHRRGRLVGYGGLGRNFNFGGPCLAGRGETGDGTAATGMMKIKIVEKSSPRLNLDGVDSRGRGRRGAWYRDAARPPTPTLDLVVPGEVGSGRRSPAASTATTVKTTPERRPPRWGQTPTARRPQPARRRDLCGHSPATPRWRSSTATKAALFVPPKWSMSSPNR